MSAAQAKHDTAEALYVAILKEVERVNQYTRDSADILEKLAHAYSMVAASPAGDPSKCAGRVIALD